MKILRKPSKKIKVLVSYSFPWDRDKLSNTAYLVAIRENVSKWYEDGNFLLESPSFGQHDGVDNLGRLLDGTIGIIRFTEGKHWWVNPINVRFLPERVKLIL